MIQSTPAVTASATACRERAWIATGLASRCASSTAQLELLESERAELGGTRAGAGDLDQIDSVLDLVANLLEQFVAAAHEAHRTTTRRCRSSEGACRRFPVAS